MDELNVAYLPLNQTLDEPDFPAMRMSAAEMDDRFGGKGFSLEGLQDMITCLDSAWAEEEDALVIEAFGGKILLVATIDTNSIVYESIVDLMQDFPDVLKAGGFDLAT